MTKIIAGVGGPGPSSPAVGRQGARLTETPVVGPNPEIDWTDPAYATPAPAPKRRFGKYTAPILPDVPQLPERNIRVRAVAPATYYTTDGVPIGTDWTSLPMSPGLLAAVKAGDLERDKEHEEAPPSAPQRVQRPQRRHTIQAQAPNPPGE